MLEALAAFAVAGNVLQFVQLGIKLLLKTSEISKAAGGQTKELTELESTNKALLNFNNDLNLRLGQEVKPVPDHLRALSDVNKECLKLAEDYLGILNDLKVEGPTATRLASFKAAWRTLHSKDKLSNIQQRQERLKSDLSLALLAVIQHEVANNHGQSMLGLRDARTVLARDLAEVKNNTILTLTQMQQSLVGQIANLSIKDDLLQSRISSLHDMSQTALLDMADRMEDIEGGCRAIADTQKTIYKTMVGCITSQEQVRCGIITSLQFSLMANRVSQISTAHLQTFDWIMKPALDGQTLWDDFVAWLNDEKRRQLYWVQGKPGSGKSTLMKFLERDLIRYESPERKHATKRDFVVASYYFWSAGDKLQHSISGLLRTILCTLLQANPSQMKSFVNKLRWSSSFHADSPHQTWSQSELFETLRRTLEGVSATANVVLLIDGLDEIDASDDDKVSLITLLKDLTTTTSVKICVSSRPWLVFKDELEDSPQLRLEDLTKRDIELYVRDTLSSDQRFIRMHKVYPAVLDTICDTIVRKAQGVFLWVRLAIREIIKEIRDGANEHRLLDILSSIPNDLDAFFRRILESVDDKYRRDTAILLQVVMCNLSSKGYKKGKGRPALPGLKVFHLEWLDEARKPHFFTSVDPFPVHEISQAGFSSRCAERQKRRIASRGMGLLEITKSGTEDDVFENEITFLHRTVHDWLVTPLGLLMVQNYAKIDYDAHLFRCSTLVFDAAARTIHSKRSELVLFLDALVCLMCQIPLRATGQELFDVYETFINISITHVYDSFRWIDSKYPQLIEVVRDLMKDESTPLTIAIQLGWADYVGARCVRRELHPKRRSLLDYALRPCLSSPCNPNAEAAISIVQYTRESMGMSTFRTRLRQIWPCFLLYMCQIKSFDRQACLPIIRVLLHLQNANFRITPHDLLSAWEESSMENISLSDSTRLSFSHFPCFSTKDIQAIGVAQSSQRVIDILPLLVHLHAPNQYLFDGLRSDSKGKFFFQSKSISWKKDEMRPVLPGTLFFETVGEDDDMSDQDDTDELNIDRLNDDGWVVV